MTKLLEDAISKVRQLPDADQDEAAEILFALASRLATPEPLDDATRAAINEGLEQVRRGEFVSDEEMRAFFLERGVNPRSI